MTTQRDWDPDAIPGEEVPKSVPPMVELGNTGLRYAGGVIDEEFLPHLRGRKAVQVYREMSDNDPTVGALVFAIDRLLRNLDWNVKPASDSAEDQQAAEFVEQCMEDMSHSWGDFISEACSMVPYGWAWHEIVYKQRVGPWEADPKKKSKFTDNKIGWRKIPIRSQETMIRWVFDETGGTQAMVQMAPPRYEVVPIPITKSLLFRTSVAKGNPEGRSMLRNAYRPWYLKKRLEEHEAIGVERDLTGMPVGKLPASYFTAPPGSAEEKVLIAYRKMVRGVRRDEQEGVLVPIEYDENGNELFGFELMTSGGTRQFDTNTIINRYEERILGCVLADFIMVGHQDGGSYSLHTDKTGLFRTSINSLAQSIADVLNRHAIPRLFEVNDWKLDQLPEFVPGDVDPPDLEQLSAFVTAMTNAGMVFFPDPELEKFLRQAARLPELTEQQEAVREAEARQAEIMRVAQGRMAVLDMSMQAQQGALGIQQQQQDVAGSSPEDQQRRMEEEHQMKLGAMQQKTMQAGDAHKVKLQQMKADGAQKLSATKQNTRLSLSQTREMGRFKLSAAKKAAAAKKTPPPKGKK